MNENHQQYLENKLAQDKFSQKNSSVNDDEDKLCDEHDEERDRNFAVLDVAGHIFISSCILK